MSIAEHALYDKDVNEVFFISFYSIEKMEKITFGP